MKGGNASRMYILKISEQHKVNLPKLNIYILA